MLNAQLEETGGTAERELGAVVAATLPRSAFVRTFRTKSGGYDVEAEWQTNGQAADMLWDKGFDIDAVAPSAFFVDESSCSNTLQ
ncbi:hypothetical protein R8510_02950 [Ralstonia chuxiongensis]|nr:hypothetical protein R8510_02950 [Ralstonia chuxiongensis]